MANKHRPIDWDRVELFAKSGANQEKIAKGMGIDRDTLRKRVKLHYGIDYTEWSAQYRTQGELLIEAKQFQKAMEGNIKMLIFLGKVRCGQNEHGSDMTSKSPIQDHIDASHENMILRNRIRELESKLNDAD